MRTRKNVFSRKKSQSLIFQVNISLYIWYITIYKNDTFQKKAREVSSKYHKIGRSIIKNRQASYETGEISNENAPIIERNASTIPTNMVTQTHVHGYGWPRTRVCVTKTMGSHTQSLGQPCPVWFNDFSWPLLVLFVRRVDSVKTYFIIYVDLPET